MGVTSDDRDTCAVCLERVCSVAADGKFPFDTLNIWILFSFCGICWLAYRDDSRARYFCIFSSSKFNFCICLIYLASVLLLMRKFLNLFAYVGCGHELCVKCALYLCSTSNIQSEMTGSSGSIPCPLCRHGIISFVKLSSATEKEKQLHLSLSICNSCMLHNGDAEDPVSTCLPDIRRNRVAMISSDVFCPVTCSPFHSSAIPVCTCNNGTCPSFESWDVGTEDESHRQSQTNPIDQVKLGGQRPETTCCSSMFCGRRSCSRENQCNSEINAWHVWSVSGQSSGRAWESIVTAIHSGCSGWYIYIGNGYEVWHKVVRFCLRLCSLFSWWV